MNIWDEVNNEILPYALMMGIDYELFWSLNPRSMKPFIKAFELKQQIIDSNNYTLGSYIQVAIGSVLSPKDVKYPKVPFSQMNKDVDKAELDAERFKRNMGRYNRKFDKEDLDE